KIETVSHAIALLGCQSIRILCASESFMAIFPRRKGNFAALFQSYCQHSLTTALLAKILAEEMAVQVESEKVFIAGLLHDIGKPVLWYNFLDQSTIYHDLRARNLSELEAERLSYGVDHAEVGAWVAGEWGLDSELAKAMAHHHESQYCSTDSVAKELSEYSLEELVGLANILAKCLELKDGKLVFQDAAERFARHRLQGLDWLGVVSLFADQAPLYGLELPPVLESNGRCVDSAELGKVVSEPDFAYDNLLDRSLTLFKAYSSFLDNFKLTDIFAGIRENLASLDGVKAVYIMLYKSREQSLTIQTASGEGTSAKVGQRILLEADEFDGLREAKDLLRSFNTHKQVSGDSFDRKLKTLFLHSQKSEQGIFLPVYNDRRLIGAFCLKLEEESSADDPIFRELLFGHAVQLALAVRFYHLTQKLKTLASNNATAANSSSLVMGHALKAPLATLRENIYMLDQEGRNAGFARSGYRHVYCQKMKRALEDVNVLISRYATAANKVVNGSEKSSMKQAS
ncbi:HDOD domain-containing protein, partial [bacterium]|nr:HDOD domain-containing protein [bacterium]